MRLKPPKTVKRKPFEISNITLVWIRWLRRHTETKNQISIEDFKNLQQSWSIYTRPSGTVDNWCSGHSFKISKKGKQICHSRANRSLFGQLMAMSHGTGCKRGILRTDKDLCIIIPSLVNIWFVLKTFFLNRFLRHKCLSSYYLGNLTI